MRDNTEIAYEFTNIDDAINEIKALQNRAIACSNMKYEMQDSKGASKTALIETFDAMADLAASVGIMLGGIITQLKFAKSHMKQEDGTLSDKMSR
jgi:hypothetical protein